MLSKRKFTFWNTDTPLTSKRVSIILGNPEDSKKLADAARTLRHSKNTSTISLSEETKKKLEAAENSLKNAS